MDPRQLALYEQAGANSPEQQDEETTVGDYDVIRTLGAGTFGRVVLCRHRLSGALVAIKLLPRGDHVRQYKTYVAREILHHASLRHPFIVSLKEVMLTAQSLAMSMEYAAGGDLYRHLLSRPQRRLCEGEARWLFQQLILGLAYCHGRGVANRDLKLENLLLDRATATAGYGSDWPLLKICDFGYSKHELNSTAKSGVGTPIYMAPEVISGSTNYDAKRADVWSCGIILYTLLFGQYPFDLEDKNFACRIILGQWSLPAGVSVSQECQSLLHSMLVVDPAQRIDVPAICQHPWFLQDLPEGAAGMNGWYLQKAPDLQPYVAAVVGMVEAATREGVPGEQLQVVSLEPPPTPAVT